MNCSPDPQITDVRLDDACVVLPFEEQHYPVSYWASRWGFSAKTVREWFCDEWGPGILRQAQTGRRKKRDYTTMTITRSAAARIYAKRTKQANDSPKWTT